MANKRVEIMDLKQLLQLKASGKSNRMIAQVLGRSRNTVNEYVQLFKQCSQSIAELSKLELGELHKLVLEHKAQTGGEADERFKELKKNRETYLADLKRKGATYQTVWQEYRQS